MDLTKRGQSRLLSNYRDHIVELSNGTLMRVGVCQNCKELLVSGKIVKKTADNILKRHKDYWATDEHAPRGFEDFEIIDPNTDEEKFAKKRKGVFVAQEKALTEQKANFEAMHEIEEARIKKELETQAGLSLNINLEI